MGDWYIVTGETIVEHGRCGRTDCADELGGAEL
jgi:hypothetical protein